MLNGLFFLPSSFLASTSSSEGPATRFLCTTSSTVRRRREGTSLGRLHAQQPLFTRKHELKVCPRVGGLQRVNE